MQINEFEKELKAIDSNLSIRPNNPPQRIIEAFPDTLKLASILYYGSEICSIPSGEIYEESNSNYGVDLRADGRFVKHRTRPDALKQVHQTLDRLKNDKDYSDQFFGRGIYSDEALMSKSEPVTEVITEVPIDAKEVRSGTLEANV